MKRVFEGKFFTKSSKTAGGIVKTLRLYKTCVDFLGCLVPNRSFRITVEDLPESKPNNNCGNCGRYSAGNCHLPGAVIQIQEIVKSCGDWQPKADETQEWEQRLCAKCNNGCPGNDRCLYLITIRAEIERVRLEEQNKHREGEK